MEVEQLKQATDYLRFDFEGAAGFSKRMGDTFGGYRIEKWRPN
jgi:hypothetical protein